MSTEQETRVLILHDNVLILQQRHIQMTQLPCLTYMVPLRWGLG